MFVCRTSRATSGFPLLSVRISAAASVRSGWQQSVAGTACVSSCLTAHRTSTSTLVSPCMYSTFRSITWPKETRASSWTRQLPIESNRHSQSRLARLFLILVLVEMPPFRARPEIEVYYLTGVIYEGIGFVRGSLCLFVATLFQGVNAGVFEQHLQLFNQFPPGYPWRWRRARSGEGAASHHTLSRRLWYGLSEKPIRVLTMRNLHRCVEAYDLNRRFELC